MPKNSIAASTQKAMALVDELVMSHAELSNFHKVTTECIFGMLNNKETLQLHPAVFAQLNRLKALAEEINQGN